MKYSTPKLNDVITQLACRRSIFHSEADFQHALAWELHMRFPNANISLERPYRTDSTALHLDLLVQNDEWSLAIELKYKTKKFQHLNPNQSFHLLNQNAQDLGRYDYLKDIWRLEVITRTIPNCTGWAILLTNDASYWTASKKTGSTDSEFRLCDGTVMNGTRDWGPSASAGTKKNREKPISLSNSYHFQWHEYFEHDLKSNGIFKYLGVEVSAPVLQ